MIRDSGLLVFGPPCIHTLLDKPSYKIVEW